MEVLEDATIHPYVKATVVVALDKVHGKNWRSGISPEKIKFAYPSTDNEIAKSYFLPLKINIDFIK